MDGRRRDAAGPATQGLRPGHRGQQRPVFVDISGRRRRLWQRIGIAVGSVLVIGLGLLVSGLFGNTPLGTPSWPSAQIRNHGTPTARPTVPPTPRKSPATPVAEPAAPTRSPTAPSASAPQPTPSTTRPGNGRRPSHTPGNGRPSKPA